MAKHQPPFEQATLEAICKALADTDNGLTGTEIGNILANCRIADEGVGTKWKRLYNAFVVVQNKKQSGAHVIGFIHHALKPARWTRDRQKFEWLRDEVTKALSFAGLEVREDGGVYRAEKASTLSEAEKRAKSLRSKLEARGVHPDVLRFCKAELLHNNHFHAVLEASKSVANKIRTKSGLDSDGAKLATDAFSLGSSGLPKLAINTLQTETEKGEQRGFANLLIGLFGTFRNPTAHAEKIYWSVNEQDALDIMGLISLVHRKLDDAVPTDFAGS